MHVIVDWAAVLKSICWLVVPTACPRHSPWVLECVKPPSLLSVSCLSAEPGDCSAALFSAPFSLLGPPNTAERRMHASWSCLLLRVKMLHEAESLVFCLQGHVVSLYWLPNALSPLSPLHPDWCQHCIIQQHIHATRYCHLSHCSCSAGSGLLGDQHAIAHACNQVSCRPYNKYSRQHRTAQFFSYIRALCRACMQRKDRAPFLSRL